MVYRIINAGYGHGRMFSIAGQANVICPHKRWNASDGVHGRFGRGTVSIIRPLTALAARGPAAICARNAELRLNSAVRLGGAWTQRSWLSGQAFLHLNVSYTCETTGTPASRSACFHSVPLLGPVLRARERLYSFIFCVLPGEPVLKLSWPPSSFHFRCVMYKGFNE